MKRSSSSETKLRQSIERGEWRHVAGGSSRKARTYVDAAKTTLRKNRRINIRINEADLEAIQQRALEEGLPYQSLVTSVLHKYATGRLG
jgi:predicted DNA binding CopG/RHH family protein